METEDKAGSSPAGKAADVVSHHLKYFSSSDISLVHKCLNCIFLK